MLKTAEAVSLGHPDKTCDYISSYILDRLIEQDSTVRYAVEVMLKDNNIILGGEVSGRVDLSNINAWIHSALSDIGYTSEYSQTWGEYTINPNKLNIINLIGQQSSEISLGIDNNGWGDQGIFIGYACQGKGNISHAQYLAQKLNKALYQKALSDKNLGLDIKTQITLDNNNKIAVAIAAIPMLQEQDLTNFIIQELQETPNKIIINGTGSYKYHSSIADCGITGRKLACDFYSAVSPIGGGSPWTKDASKADLSLNLYARYLALQNLKDNDECFVYLSSCIGKCELPSAEVKTIKNGITNKQNIKITLTPQEIINLLGLNKPIFAKLCKEGLLSLT